MASPGFDINAFVMNHLLGKEESPTGTTQRTLQQTDRFGNVFDTPATPPQRASFLNEMVESLIGGGIETSRAVQAYTNVISGDDAKVKEITKRQRHITESREEFHEALSTRLAEHGDETLMAAFRNVFPSIAEKPVGAIQETVAMLPHTAATRLPMITFAWIGAKIGTALFLPTGPGAIAGGVLGALAGGAIGLLAGNIFLEGGFEAQELMEEGKYDRDRALQVGIVKGGVMSGFDVFSGGAAGAAKKFITGAPMVAATRRASEVVRRHGANPADDAAVAALLRRNPRVATEVARESSRAAVDALPSTSRMVALRAFQVLLESLGEGGGEYYGSKAAGLDESLTEAVLEAALSFPTSAVDIAIAGKVFTTNQVLSDPDAILRKYGIDPASASDADANAIKLLEWNPVQGQEALTLPSQPNEPGIVHKANTEGSVFGLRGPASAFLASLQNAAFGPKTFDEGLVSDEEAARAAEESDHQRRLANDPAYAESIREQQREQREEGEGVAEFREKSRQYTRSRNMTQLIESMRDALGVATDVELSPAEARALDISTEERQFLRDLENYDPQPIPEIGQPIEGINDTIEDLIAALDIVGSIPHSSMRERIISRIEQLMQQERGEDSGQPPPRQKGRTFSKTPVALAPTGKPGVSKDMIQHVEGWGEQEEGGFVSTMSEEEVTERGNNAAETVTGPSVHRDIIRALLRGDYKTLRQLFERHVSRTKSERDKVFASAIDHARTLAEAYGFGDNFDGEILPNARTVVATVRGGRQVSKEDVGFSIDVGNFRFDVYTHNRKSYAVQTDLSVAQRSPGRHLVLNDGKPFPTQEDAMRFLSAGPVKRALEAQGLPARSAARKGITKAAEFNEGFKLLKVFVTTEEADRRAKREKERPRGFRMTRLDSPKGHYTFRIDDVIVGRMYERQVKGKTVFSPVGEAKVNLGNNVTDAFSNYKKHVGLDTEEAMQAKIDEIRGGKKEAKEAAAKEAEAAAKKAETAAKIEAAKKRHGPAEKEVSPPAKEASPPAKEAAPAKKEGKKKTPKPKAKPKPKPVVESKPVDETPKPTIKINKEKGGWDVSMEIDGVLFEDRIYREEQREDTTRGEWDATSTDRAWFSEKEVAAGKNTPLGLSRTIALETLQSTWEGKGRPKTAKRPSLWERIKAARAEQQKQRDLRRKEQVQLKSMSLAQRKERTAENVAREAALKEERAEERKRFEEILTAMLEKSGRKELPSKEDLEGFVNMTRASRNQQALPSEIGALSRQVSKLKRMLKGLGSKNLNERFEDILMTTSSVLEVMQWLSTVVQDKSLKTIIDRFITVLEQKDAVLFTVAEGETLSMNQGENMQEEIGLHLYSHDTGFSFILLRDLTWGRDENGLNIETFLHEVAHVMTARKYDEGSILLERGQNLDSDLAKATENINILLDEVRDRIQTLTEEDAGFLAQFGLTDDLIGRALEKGQEFMAYGFSHSGFKKLLNSIKAARQTGMSAFVTKIRELLGLAKSEETALSLLIQFSEDLMTARAVLSNEEFASVMQEKLDGSQETRGPPEGFQSNPMRTRAIKNENTLTLSAEEQKLMSELIGKDNSLLAGVRGFFQGANHIRKNLLNAVINEVERIAPKLTGRLNNMEYEINSTNKRLKDTLQPFMAVGKALPKKYKELFKHHWNNQDIAALEKMIDGIGLNGKEVMSALRSVLNELRDGAIEIGLIYESEQNYLPRQIEDFDGFMRVVHQMEYDKKKVPIEKQRAWSPVLQAIKDKRREVGRELTKTEKIQAIKDIMNVGSDLAMRRPGATKQRTIKKVHPLLNEFYMNPFEVLAHHIDSMVEGIETRRFLGNTPIKKQMQQLRKIAATVESLTGVIANTEPTDTSYQGLIEQREAALTAWDRLSDKITDSETILEDSVAALIDSEVDPENQHRAKEIIMARMKQIGPNSTVGTLRNAAYIFALGSVNSALTQVGDQTLNLVRFRLGAFSAMIEAAIALWNREGYVQNFFDFTRTQQDFPTGRWAGALDTLFTYTGMKGIDLWGKETSLRGFINKYGKVARANNWKGFDRKWGKVLGDKVTRDAFEALKRGEKNNAAVMQMAFVGLSEFQPVHLSKMSPGYLRGGNLRPAYMLKTFSLAVLNGAYQEAWIDYQNKHYAKSAGKMMTTLLLLALVGAGMDEIKDWLNGKDEPFSDAVTENFIQLLLLNRYKIGRGLDADNAFSAIIHGLMPPVTFADDIAADLWAVLNEEKDQKFKTRKSAPIFGKMWYARSEAGVESMLERRKKEIQEAYTDGKNVATQLRNHNRIARESGIPDMTLTLADLRKGKIRSEKRKEKERKERERK